MKFFIYIKNYVPFWYIANVINVKIIELKFSGVYIQFIPLNAYVRSPRKYVI